MASLQARLLLTLALIGGGLLATKTAIELSRVEAALRSIDDGTYGTCTNCGNPIGAERLQAIPWVPTCIDCARKLER